MIRDALMKLSVMYDFNARRLQFDAQEGRLQIDYGVRSKGFVRLYLYQVIKQCIRNLQGLLICFIQVFLYFSVIYLWATFLDRHLGRYLARGLCQFVSESICRFVCIYLYFSLSLLEIDYSCLPSRPRM